MRARNEDSSSRAERGATRRPAARPSTLPPLTALQQAAGNAAVTRAVQRAREEAGHAEGATQEAAPVQRRVSVRDAIGSPGRPLDSHVLARSEQAYQMDFSHVRVHDSPVAQRSAEELDALAYTSGSHIVLGKRAVSDAVLYEEVDHVRQQMLGPVPGTDNGKGEKVSRPDDPFELSAGANGRRMAQGAAPDLSLPGAAARTPGAAAPVQRADRPGPSRVAAPRAAARLARLLVGGGEEVKDKQVRGVLHRRVRGGPSLTTDELQAIRAVEAEDPGWLKAVGLCGHAEAQEYIAAGDFHDWLEQPEGKRLLVATLRWQQEAAGRAEGKPPSTDRRSDYQMGRHMAMHGEDTPQAEKEQLTAERNEQIFATFINTLAPPGISDSVPDADKHRERVARGTELLTKIFLLLKEGLKVFNPDSGLHEDFRDDVAHALAYGGRVNIRIPQLADGQHGYELPQWLHITKEDRKPWEPRSTPAKPVYRRAFGTHHMEIDENHGTTKGDFVEKGEIGATLQNWVDPHSHLYGFPLAINGLGNQDYHGDTILPNESYGHAFMGYKPPTGKRDGALQVGIETAGPGGRTPDGYQHGLTSSEKNNNPVSQIGGHKDDKPGGNAPLSASQRLVDLNDFGDWVQKLRDLEAQWDAALAAVKTPEQRTALYRDLIGRRTNIGT
ncbi:eCIS core domain-containing protein [Streptomyces albidoflavus]